MQSGETKVLVDREKLLRKLSTLTPGLDLKSGIGQADSFLFLDDKVITANDMVLCCCENPLDGYTGAVPAEPLLGLLEKIPEKEITLELTEDLMKIRAKRKRSAIAVEPEVLFKSSVDVPDNWHDLGRDFQEAVKIGSSCVARQLATRTTSSCIHITDQWIESADANHACRYEIYTGVEEPVLVDGRTFRKIVDIDGLCEMGITESWVTLRTTDGLVVSCRRYSARFPDFSEILSGKGETITIPDTLSEVLKRCGVFSGQDIVFVELKPGKMILEARSGVGWYKEMIETDYEGVLVKFRITSKLLLEISKKTSQCLMSSNKLLVETDKFRYATCTNEVEDDDDD
jgi:DNA polymerase III sliding clamp (beta) subunit (PCNA family)